VVEQKMRDEHGNCTGTTIVLTLERLLCEGRVKPGEWSVMMAFGPGLTLEIYLLQF
jgi:predicted naringenin-chalcone synthase